MARFIMRAKDDEWIDHKNHDSLDNQKSNLRVCNNMQNQWNQRKHRDSKNPYKGVRPLKAGFEARIMIAGKRISLGYYKTSEEAAKAYDNAALHYRGEFARQTLNLK